VFIRSFGRWKGTRDAVRLELGPVAPLPVDVAYHWRVLSSALPSCDGVAMTSEPGRSAPSRLADGVHPVLEERPRGIGNATIEFAEECAVNPSTVVPCVPSEILRLTRTMSLPSNFRPNASSAGPFRTPAS
jgi:hypothetical protein